METEDDMEVEHVFVAYEIDVDYEYDAARYFDFSREETEAEAREAECWFETAISYPPSPKLFLREDVLLENVNTSPKPKNIESTTSSVDGDCNVGVGQEFYAMDVTNRDCGGTERGIFGNLQKVLNQPYGLTTGLTLYNYLTSNKPKGKVNSSVKPSFVKTSTLMKPTACQLAKQNQAPQVGSRFQMLSAQNKEKSLCSSSGVESQAPKRQKLEGGHLRKDTDVKQQANLVHKVPKKDGTIDKNTAHSKLKLTIPREPDLETAHRAQRIRSKNGAEPGQVILTTHRFKARPFNRKIFEAPSLPLPKRSAPKLPEFQEFHLKTSERAMQNASTVSSSSQHCKESEKGLEKSSSIVAENGKRDSKRPNVMEAPKQDGGDVIHQFKARPLNKKIFSSKGDIGVFRNSKRETTVPMEFNFHTGKRTQHNPPTDLFSKLSLTTELQPNNGSQLKMHQRSSITVKITDLVKENPPVFGGKQIQFGSDGSLADVGHKLHIRSLGIR
ncbi:hypothetical protein FEM48_Zijuj11G0049400 [Ziziphus jujuba var. spinosa]|uniref:TPX2 central domain-containing protein n=1 Tax=Ziziphus jujuba var. spinosa TaxID=714518 RepID=A0A978UGY8_ZIZJJ|nr:hypothetical protein FEM48_Zijuj11G0049400 [Ziziphus jujuba var. spinosa]